MEELGFVVIGRNEGSRLQKCLTAILSSHPNPVVCYVDSGSTDSSIEYARSIGCLVIDLDLSIPFSAARARNEGWRRIATEYPEVKYIHFIDGDCVLADHWLGTAMNYLRENKRYAVVCGRRKEKYPEASIYNAMCDHEWDTPVGEAKACGGDALMRVEALKDVGGYKDYFIAGEEPELCFRFRHKGWKIYRADKLMTFHDANITRFSQFWKRAKRCGFAYALSAAEHGSNKDEAYKIREVLRSSFWGGCLPAIFITGGIFSIYIPICVFGIYLADFIRKIFKAQNSAPLVHPFAFVFFQFVGKFAECHGLISFGLDRLLRKKSGIIEYK